MIPTLRAFIVEKHKADTSRREFSAGKNSLSSLFLSLLLLSPFSQLEVEVHEVEQNRRRETGSTLYKGHRCWKWLPLFLREIHSSSPSRSEACVSLHSLQMRDAIRDFDQWRLNTSSSTSRRSFAFESHLQFVFCLSSIQSLILIHRKHCDETGMKIIKKNKK